MWHAAARQDQLFVLGLARAEHRGPEGYNRLGECSEALLRQLEEEAFEEYCGSTAVGLDCSKIPVFNVSKVFFLMVKVARPRLHLSNDQVS